jgi:hypothetical protein
MSGVNQCIRFGEKRDAHFERGKEHVRRLLLPRGGATRGCSGMVVCGDGQQTELMASGLTRGVRQLIGLKGCLGRILL